MAKKVVKAKKAKKIKTKEGLTLSIVNPNAAGIDVSSTEMQVCVPEDRDGDNNRCFGTFTEDLHLISSWLKACGIDTVAMESTGIYWVQLYMILEADGFDVLLVNAKAIKNIGEKKTDEVDAEWIMLLHSYGLLKASFQPDNYARRIRNVSRHRDALLRSSSKEVQHIQKAMELMNIKLTNVISDILGKTGQAILSAIIAGERDASKLALLADPRCKSPKEIIEKSLVGNWDTDLLFTLKQSFELYHYLQNQMKDCDKQIETILQEYIATLPAEQTSKEFPKSKKVKSKKNEIFIDIEDYASKVFGVNLMRMPGLSDGALLRLVGELGYSFTDNFETYKEFCCWANLTPNNKISGGKILSSKVPRRKNQVGLILRSCANSLKASKTPLGFYFRRIQAKSGYIPAIIATANKLGRILYTLAKNKTEYNESLLNVNENERLKKRLCKIQKEMKKIENQLNKCA
ncbi:MAG: IS110 family transposase [Tannerella sp.]|jgi:transposase|nr:IS110 family transposase [Tannerella sp.]